MSIPATIRSRPLLFLFGFAVATLLALLLVPPIPQSQIYHGFADSRSASSRSAVRFPSRKKVFSDASMRSGG